jgi:hypothetical protein
MTFMTLDLHFQNTHNQKLDYIMKTIINNKKTMFALLSSLYHPQ